MDLRDLIDVVGSMEMRRERIEELGSESDEMIHEEIEEEEDEQRGSPMHVLEYAEGQQGVVEKIKLGIIMQDLVNPEIKKQSDNILPAGM